MGKGCLIWIGKLYLFLMLFSISMGGIGVYSYLWITLFLSSNKLPKNEVALIVFSGLALTFVIGFLVARTVYKSLLDQEYALSTEGTKKHIASFAASISCYTYVISADIAFGVTKIEKLSNNQFTLKTNPFLSLFFYIVFVVVLSTFIRKLLEYKFPGKAQTVRWTVLIIFLTTLLYYSLAFILIHIYFAFKTS